MSRIYRFLTLHKNASSFIYILCSLVSWNRLASNDDQDNIWAAISIQFKKKLILILYMIVHRMEAKNSQKFLSVFFQDQYSILCKRENTDLLNIYFVDRIFCMRCNADIWACERNYFDINHFRTDYITFNDTV